MKNAKVVLLLCFLVPRLLFAALTPNQVLAQAAAWQGVPDNQLQAAQVALTSLIALGAVASPSSILASAAAWQGVSDRQLQEAEAYLLSSLQVSGTGGLNPSALFVSTNGNATTAVRGSQTLPFPSFTNALANAQPGDTIILSPGQTFDLGTNTMTLSNITIVAWGANLTFSNFLANLVFKITGDLTWLGGKVTDLGTATDGSGIVFPFNLQRTASGAYNVRFLGVVMRSRSDGLSGPSGAMAGVPFMTLIDCDWEDFWDLFTLDGGGPSSGRAHYEFIGCRLVANATTHAGSFGNNASIAVIGHADAYFTGCTLFS